MAPSPSLDTGRWVIVLGDNAAPVFWSVDRDSLDAVCAHVRRTCPTARVEWQANPEDGQRHDPRDRVPREIAHDDARDRE